MKRIIVLVVATLLMIMSALLFLYGRKEAATIRERATAESSKEE